MLRRHGKETEHWNEVPYYTGLGFIIPAAAIAGVLIGWGLDRIFHTEPVLEVAFAIAGGAAGVWELLRVVKKAGESARAKEDQIASKSEGGRSISG